jgi:hypothetical protein
LNFSDIDFFHGQVSFLQTPSDFKKKRERKEKKREKQKKEKGEEERRREKEEKINPLVPQPCLLTHTHTLNSTGT